MDYSKPRDLGGYRLASLVQLVRNGPCWTLLVDGQRFPWLVDRVVDARLDSDEIPSVTITLIADHVQIDNARGRGAAPAHPQAWDISGAVAPPESHH